MKTAVEIYSNHRQLLEKELASFVSSYSGPSPDSIKALADKIDHMCNNIGCPSSVLPMLSAILRGTKHIKFPERNNEYNGVGHFRWNWKIYTLQDSHLNHIRNFYFSGQPVDLSFDKTNEYDQQAIKFLNAHACTLTGKHLKRGKYFSDDEQERDIYEIHLKRGSKEYIFTFGQSLANTKKGVAPSAYDVLACLTKYEPGTFEDFCSEFGYDTDSKRAEKTYNAVRDEYLNVSRLFNEDEMEMLREIQ